jgi:hypothetical protein
MTLLKHILAEITLIYVVVTMVLGHIVETMTLHTIFASYHSCICYSLGCPADIIACDVA